MTNSAIPSTNDGAQQLHDRYFAQYAASGAKCTYLEWLEFHFNLTEINNNIFRQRIANLEARVAVSKLPDSRFRA